MGGISNLGSFRKLPMKLPDIHTFTIGIEHAIINQHSSTNVVNYC